MTILHWNFITLLILSAFFLRNKDIKFSRNFYLLLITLQFIIIHGFGHFSVGIDSVRYYQRFIQAANVESLNELFSLHRFEPLYTLLEGTIGFFTKNYTIFFLSTSILIFIPVTLFIYNNSRNYFLSFFFYIVLRYFDFNMNVVRQAIAMSISLLAFKYAKEKNIYKFLLIVAIATLFHYSAVIILPIYFLVNIKPDKKYIYITIVLLMSMAILNQKIGQLLHSFYYNYVVTTYVPVHTSTGSIGMTGVFILSVIILGFFIQNPLSKNTSQKSRALFFLVATSFLVHSLSVYSYMYKRLSMYYLIYIIIYIPEILSTNNIVSSPFNEEKVRVYQKIIVTGLVLLFTIYYIALINDDPYGVLPYLTFLSN